jgi:hypothetical protein
MTQSVDCTLSYCLFPRPGYGRLSCNYYCELVVQSRLTICDQDYAGCLQQEHQVAVGK